MKKGLINVITLALVLVNLILTIILVFSFVPAVNKTSNLVDKIAEIVDLNVSGNSTTETTTGEVTVNDLENVSVTFDSATSTTVSLKTEEGGSTHYVKLSVALSVNTLSEDYEEKRALIDTSMGMIDSKIIDVVSTYTYDTVDKSSMQEEVKNKLNELLDTECIYSVSFSQFVIQ